MTTPAADGHHRHVSKPVDTAPDDDPRNTTLGRITLIALAVLVLIMAVQTFFVLSYGSTLRHQQDALLCQANQTDQLRTAAGLERQAQRDLLTTMITVNPAKTKAEQQQAGAAAIQKYLTSLQQSDAERAAVPDCPKPDTISSGPIG